MTPIPIYALNDLALTVGPLKTVNPATGAKEPLTTGVTTAFLATSNEPTAAAADPTMSVVATHVGGGKWLVLFDASLLTPQLLAQHFAATPPYLIIEQVGAIRAYVECSYQPSRPAEVS